LGLTEIPGVGPARAKALLRAFKTIAAIREADVDALAAVSGMTRPAAEQVYKYYHGETE
jgi:excinuclease ABC subunit C